MKNFSEETRITDSTEQTTTLEETVREYVEYWISNVSRIEDDERRNYFTRLMADVLSRLYGFDAGVEFLFDLLAKTVVPISGRAAPDQSGP